MRMGGEVNFCAGKGKSESNMYRRRNRVGEGRMEIISMIDLLLEKGYVGIYSHCEDSERNMT